MADRRRPGRAAAVGVAVLAAGLLACPPAVAAHGVPYVSEIDYDNPGGDSSERIEISGPEGLDLAGWSVVLYDGDDTSRASYRRTSLSGRVGESGTFVLAYPVSNSIRNDEPGGVALVDPDGRVAEFVSYGGSFTAARGPAAGLVSDDLGVLDADEPGTSVQRDPVDHDRWYGPAPHSFGVRNGSAPLEPRPVTCADEPTHDIGEVQGPGEKSPLEGEVVTVRGVVATDLRDGFHLEDPDLDGDRRTRDTVFVVPPADSVVDLGQRVIVTGTVREVDAVTQVEADSLDYCGEALEDGSGHDSEDGSDVPAYAPELQPIGFEPL